MAWRWKTMKENDDNEEIIIMILMKNINNGQWVLINENEMKLVMILIKPIIMIVIMINEWQWW